MLPKSLKDMRLLKCGFKKTQRDGSKTVPLKISYIAAPKGSIFLTLVVIFAVALYNGAGLGVNFVVVFVSA